MKKNSLFLLLIFCNCSITKEEIRLDANWKKISEKQFPVRRNFGTVFIEGKIVVIGGYIQTG